MKKVTRYFLMILFLGLAVGQVCCMEKSRSEDNLCAELGSNPVNRKNEVVFFKAYYNGKKTSRFIKCYNIKTKEERTIFEFSVFLQRFYFDSEFSGKKLEFKYGDPWGKKRFVLIYDFETKELSDCEIKPDDLETKELSDCEIKPDDLETCDFLDDDDMPPPLESCF